MTTTIDRADLLQALQTLKPALASRVVVPILSTLYVSPREGVLRATDIDLEITAPAEFGDTCDPFCIDAGRLADAVKTLPPGPVKLGGDDSHGFVSSGRSRFKVPCLPVEDWPQVNVLVQMHDCDGNALADALEAVAHAACTEETRYYLNGAYIDTTTDPASIVATDGHRLHLVSLDSLPDDLPPVIVPSRVLPGLCAILRHDNARVGWSDAYIVAQSDAGRVRAKVIEGTYPDYSRVVPDGDKTTAKITAAPAAFATVATQAMAALKTGTSRGMAIEIDDGVAKVTAETPDSALTTEISDASTTGAMRFGVNAEYLARAADAFDGQDAITVLLSDSQAPMLIETDSRKYVLMPMRV